MSTSFHVMIPHPCHGLSRACPFRLHAGSDESPAVQFHFPRSISAIDSNDYAAVTTFQTASTISTPVRTLNTDAANTPRSQLAKNKRLADRVSKLRESSCSRGGWVHRLNRGVVESGAGAGAANETCRGRAIGKSRLSSVSLCDSVSVKTLTAVITRRTVPCCSTPCYQKTIFVSF